MKWLNVQIGGQNWRVDLLKSSSKKFEGEPLYGLTDPDNCRIYIASDQSEQSREDAFTHELLHASFHVSGASQQLIEAVEGADVAERLEENVVRALTPIWHQVLKGLGFVFPKVPT